MQASRSFPAPTLHGARRRARRSRAARAPTRAAPCASASTVFHRIAARLASPTSATRRPASPCVCVSCETSDVFQLLRGRWRSCRSEFVFSSADRSRRTRWWARARGRLWHGRLRPLTHVGADPYALPRVQVQSAMLHARGNARAASDGRGSRALVCGSRGPFPAYVPLRCERTRTRFLLAAPPRLRAKADRSISRDSTVDTLRERARPPAWRRPT